MRKTYFPKLVMLVIGKNAISEIQPVSTSHYPILGWIDIEDNQTLSQVIDCIKVKSETVDQFYAHGSSIIDSKRQRNVFKQKWKGTEEGTMKWVEDVEESGEEV